MKCELKVKKKLEVFVHLFDTFVGGEQQIVSSAQLAFKTCLIWQMCQANERIDFDRKLKCKLNC